MGEIIPGADVASGFGEKLKVKRKAKGLTQQQLATESGLSVATIRHLEQRDGDPTLSTLQAIAGALGLAVSELLAEPKK